MNQWLRGARLLLLEGDALARPRWQAFLLVPGLLVMSALAVYSLVLSDPPDYIFAAILLFMAGLFAIGIGDHVLVTSEHVLHCHSVPRASTSTPLGSIVAVGIARQSSGGYAPVLVLQDEQRVLAALSQRSPAAVSKQAQVIAERVDTPYLGQLPYVGWHRRVRTVLDDAGE